MLNEWHLALVRRWRKGPWARELENLSPESGYVVMRSNSILPWLFIFTFDMGIIINILPVSQVSFEHHVTHVVNSLPTLMFCTDADGVKSKSWSYHQASLNSKKQSTTQMRCRKGKCCQVELKSYHSQLELLQQNTQTRWLKWQVRISHCSGGCEVWCLWWRLYSWLANSPFSLCPHKVTRSSSDASSYKDIRPHLNLIASQRFHWGWSL